MCAAVRHGGDDGSTLGAWRANGSDQKVKRGCILRCCCGGGVKHSGAGPKRTAHRRPTRAIPDGAALHGPKTGRCRRNWPAAPRCTAGRYGAAPETPAGTTAPLERSVRCMAEAYARTARHRLRQHGMDECHCPGPLPIASGIPTPARPRLSLPHRVHPCKGAHARVPDGQTLARRGVGAANRPQVRRGGDAAGLAIHNRGRRGGTLPAPAKMRKRLRRSECLGGPGGQFPYGHPR